MSTAPATADVPRPARRRRKRLADKTRKKLTRRHALISIRKELQYAGPDHERHARATMALARILGYQLYEPHKEIIRHQSRTACSDDPEDDSDIVLAFRGLGKSTVGTVVRAIKYILENPDVRIAIISATKDGAKQFIDEIESHLLDNKMLHRLFGKFLVENAPTKSGRYNEQQFTVLQRKRRALREPTAMALGVGSQIASRHFDVIIYDDLVTLRESRTATQRQNIDDFHGSTAVGATMPHTKNHYLGTRYYPGDQYEILIDGREDEETGALDGRCLTIPLVTIDADGEWTPTHPERFPLRVCKRIRKKAGPYHFNAQFQMDTASGTGIFFSYADLLWYGVRPDQRVGELMPPGNLEIYQFFDLAAKKTDKGAYFAGVTIGVGDHGHQRLAWVLDLVRERAGMARQRELIYQQVKKWKPIVAGVEAVQMQGGFAEEIAERTILPVVPIKVEGDKILRATKVQPIISNHGLVMPLPETPLGEVTKPLLHEMIRFPENTEGRGEYCDTVDALVGALDLAMYGDYSRGTEMGMASDDLNFARPA